MSQFVKGCAVIVAVLAGIVVASFAIGYFGEIVQ
jgi:hypothetical protein